MFTQRTKLLFLLTIIFIFLNTTVYYISDSQKDKNIDIELKKSLRNLQTHHSILLHNHTILADAAYTSTFEDSKFIEIFEKIHNASKEEKTLLRQELYKHLKYKYEALVIQGVLQYHFILPNNESFLRMHKPDKFGDDLSGIREDFVYTNIHKVPVKAFTQGRVAHGFRNTYPIFASDSTYLGAMEVSFSSDSFQNTLTNISHIHTHFLVNKDIYDAKTWSRDDLIVKYKQSIEHKNFMHCVNDSDKDTACLSNDASIFEEKIHEVEKGINTQKEFSIYLPIDSNNTTVVSYFPIYNMHKTKTLAWLVSYENSPAISKSLQSAKYIRIIFFFVFLVLSFLLYKLIMANYSIRKDHKLVNEILNATDNIMFITDFQSVSFSNRKFKEFFSISHEDEFKTLYSKASSMFLSRENYLHDGLKQKNENFSELIKRVAQENKIVMILDKHLQEKSFSITISKISSYATEDYLVTLFDITKIKEKEFQMQEKVYLDGLTGIYNRNKFDEVLKYEIDKAQRYDGDLTLCIMDIDYFKDFNDKYGHLIGDEILSLLAEKLSTKIRESDTFARWGGEEFVILFPQTSKEEALKICEKLRVAIESIEHPIAGNVTASFGVSHFIKNDSIDTIFKRCDEALYLAKADGRNRVCFI